MAAGRRYPKHFVADPSCCPSRASLMTGRMPHNNGVRLQSQGPAFDHPHSMACYLRSAGLLDVRRRQVPRLLAADDHATVLRPLHGHVGRLQRTSPPAWTASARTMTGYSTTGLGVRGREYITGALGLGKPFLLYETPQAPHWVEVTNPDGSTTRRAVPEAKYATAPVPTCSAPVEAEPLGQAAVRPVAEPHARPGAGDVRQPAAGDHDRGRPVRRDHAAAVRPRRARQHAGDLLLGQRLHVERPRAYGEVRPVRAVDPHAAVPALGRPDRRPARTPAGCVSYVDLLPTILAAAQFTLPAGAPPLDGESLLSATRRTTAYSEYFTDPANGKVPTWRMIRTPP